MDSFLNTINYSSYNEDGTSELKALNIAPNDNVLCITGSGARTLDLLIATPNSIISIDYNPTQNFLLELKITAIRELSYDEFLAFIGIRPSSKRKTIYANIKSSLSSEALSFWDNNQSIIENGAIYCGRWERYFRLLSLAVRFTRPKLLYRLFSVSTISEQESIWREEWDNKLWRIFLKTIGGKLIWKYFLRDPGFYQHVPGDFCISDYLINKFNEAVQSVQFRRSVFATLLFWGKFIETNVLPLHMQKENFPILKRNINHINIISTGLGEHLNKCKPKSYDKYSLSDFSSYTNEVEYENIWNGIVSTARPNARICERQFLVKRDIPTKFKHFIKRNQELEEKLTREDSSIFYTFLIGQINGTKS